MLMRYGVFVLGALWVEWSVAEPVQFIAQRDAENYFTTPYDSYVEGNWYEIVPFKGTWQEAKADAEKHVWRGRQGHLATLHTPSEIQFIAGQNFFKTCSQDTTCQADYVNGLWLGGEQSSNATQTDAGWYWVTTEDWTLDAGYIGMNSYWHTGEPNDRSTDKTEAHREDYLTMTLFGTFNDISGQTVLSGYVIEYDVHGWVQWRAEDGGNDHWYRLKHADGINFPQAISASSHIDMPQIPGHLAHLATLTTPEEIDFVFNNFIALKNDPVCPVGFYTMACGLTRHAYWIGGQYDAYDNAWRVTWEDDYESAEASGVTISAGRDTSVATVKRTPVMGPSSGYIVEIEAADFPRPLLAAPNCYSPDTVALPHYDAVQETLELPYLLLRLYDASAAAYRDYRYNLALKRSALDNQGFSFMVTHFDLLDACNGTQTPPLSAAFQPEQQKQAYYANNKIEVPYLKVGNAWYSVTLSVKPQTDAYPVIFAVEAIRFLRDNNAPLPPLYGVEIPTDVYEALEFLAH